MSCYLLIDPLVLDPADFPTLPLQPGFTQLVSDDLGNAATPTDGFDAVVAETIALVDALDAALGSLAGELLDAFAEADSIDPAPVSDTAAGFTASLDPSSTAVDNLGKLLGAATPPNPAGAGGSGGGGGTPPPGGGSAVVAADFPGINCWSAWDLTSPTQDIVNHGGYDNALEVMDAGQTAFAFVTAASFFERDDNQWQRVFVTSDGGVIVHFDPLQVGKTRAVVLVTCTTAPTTRYLCVEKAVIAV